MNYTPTLETIRGKMRRGDGVGHLFAADEMAVVLVALRGAESEIDRLRAHAAALEEDLQAARAIGESFFEALKPLNLQAINVANPGQHVSDLIALVAALEEELKKWKAAEWNLSQAYIRLRELIPGAFDTGYGPTPEQVWTVTESALKESYRVKDALVGRLEKVVEAAQKRPAFPRWRPTLVSRQHERRATWMLTV